MSDTANGASPTPQSPGKPPLSNGDVEGTASTSTELRDADPFSFRNGIKTDEELVILRQRRKGKTLESYHRKQNELIGNLLKPMAVHTQEAKDLAESARLSVKIAVYASLFANIALSIIQVYAAVSSLSLSFFATAVDSVFDPMSNVLLWWLHRVSKRLDTNKWPVGGARLETIGNICYGFLMTSVNLVVIVESVHAIATHKVDDTNRFFVPAVAAVASALGWLSTGLHFADQELNDPSQVLSLFCFYTAPLLGGVQAKSMCFGRITGTTCLSTGLVRVDAVAISEISLPPTGLLMATGGSKWAWYLDPMGAIIISTGVSGAWIYRIYREFELLAGKSAPHDFIQLLVYKAMTFSNEIEKIDTVRAYHSGPNYFVEIDVAMDAGTPLWKAHDISQQLQDTAEILPNVERAFVHVDHETTHTPEHRKNL